MFLAFARAHPSSRRGGAHLRGRHDEGAGTPRLPHRSGTLYPLLHRLESDGLLSSETRVEAGKSRKYYVITRKGTLALKQIRAKVGELAHEVTPD
ncbi:MAG: PadR family transcriptional regulator [Comamonadaceae bacterium]|nr:PadR family transcriptional regulator [Comamonadaceae bacterium]